MIKYIKREKLDVKKYDKCIEDSIQSRVYAYSWYLDIVADNWDALVLNDYEAVMPLPWRKKYGLRYVYQPIFCQQLGVFSVLKISEEVIKKFIKKIPYYYVKVVYQFNSDNEIKGRNLTERDNYILKLNKPYKDLKEKYRKDRKYRINQVKKGNYTIITPKVKALLELTKEYYGFIELTEIDLNKLKRLIDFIILNNLGFMYGVNEKENILGVCFFIETRKRIVYMFSVMNPEGKKKQIASLIIDEVIEKYSKSEKILDFEGSMIEGVASFYKSFGARKEKYKLLKCSFID